MSQPKRKEETVGKQMSGDEAIAYTLSELGISRVFTTSSIPRGLFNYLSQYKIEVSISPTTETAFLMADSYARTNNSLGVVISIPGTSALDAVSIIAQGYMDSIPLLIIGSSKSSKDVSKGRIGELRTNEDVSTILSPITKVRERATSIEEITTTIEKSYKDALSNRPRPVYVDVGEDLFRVKAYPLAGTEQKPEKRTPDKNTIQKAAELLINSKTPVIIAGYGVIASNSSSELLQLAELLDIPVITTVRAKGSFQNTHDLYAGEGLGLIGTEASTRLLEEADVVFAIGTRFGQLSTAGWSVKIKGLLIHNNIDGEDIGKVYIPHLPVVGDTLLLLRELLSFTKDKVKEKVNRGIRSRVKALRYTRQVKSHQGIWPIDVVNAVFDVRGDRPIYLDLGSSTIDSIRIPVEKPNQWVTSTSIITKGIGIFGPLVSIPPSIGITDLQTTLKYYQIVKGKVPKGSKILVLNDNMESSIDTTYSEVPTLTFRNIKSRRENLLTDITTVDRVWELKSALVSEDPNTSIINVILDTPFESAVLPKSP